jgi:hypothetical protein
MIIALGVMLVTSLLLAATFVAARGDIQLSHTDTTQKEAYYASLAGVQEFEYQMQVNPNYWQTCGAPTNTLPQESGSSYAVKILPAASAPAGTKACSTANPFGTVIETSTTAANTFRIESVGSASKNPEAHHTIIATFKVTGFLNFIYYTNHEDEDPSLYSAPTECTKPNTYYPATETDGCQRIEFATGDSINGPMHTNDAACIGGSATFGRSSHTPPDVVEFYRGRNSACTGSPKYYTATGSYVKGEQLTPPTSDTSLETYATEENKFSGVTDLVLEGGTNEIDVTNAELNGGLPKKIPWPSNGLIYIKQSSSGSGACGYTYKTYEADDRNEANTETNCGNVYVSGTYGKSLTIGSADDVIINGEIYPYGDKGGEPTGTATLGLIANNFVRIYHPVKETYEGSGPELETAHNLKLEAAGHKETITVEARAGLAESVRLEVKNSGTKYEVVVLNEKSKVLEKTGLLNEAKQLIGLESPYVVYEEGAKYTEGKAEKLKTLASESLGHQEVIKVSPRTGKIGKELQVEVKESASGTEYEVVVLNSKSEKLESIGGLKEAKQLIATGTTPNVTFSRGENYSEGEKEKLKTSTGKWLDEKCNQNNKSELEKYSSTARECEYANNTSECDAPSLNKEEDKVNHWGSLENPWIYAAILSTTHSFAVDNFNCGNNLGKLHIQGAIAQNYRGIVGTGNGGTGYLKDYKYDERLAVDEPPYFLSPLEAGWKVSRETASAAG